MNITNKSLRDVAGHPFIRLDCKYWQTQNIIHFTKYELLKRLFYVINGSVQTDNYSDNKTGVPYIRISDIDYKYGLELDNCVCLDEDTYIPEEKIIQERDLILATIGATVGKIGCGKNAVGGTHSNNTVLLRPIKSDLNILFYEKLFQTDFYIRYIFGLVAQKSQPNLQPYEIGNIKIPIINEDKIDDVLNEVVAIEKEINKKKSENLSSAEIIDFVFKMEFNYSYDTFDKLRQSRVYTKNCGAFSNNPDMRFSAKFHRPAGDFVMQELMRGTDKKLKHIISEPIVLGASISPAEFDENGKAYYVSMATIKTLEIVLDDTQLVADEYYERKKADKSVAVNDIIIARSGVAIGKTAIVKDEFEGIFADFTMRIRINTSLYNPFFVYYYGSMRKFVCNGVSDVDSPA